VARLIRCFRSVSMGKRTKLFQVDFDLLVSLIKIMSWHGKAVPPYARMRRRNHLGICTTNDLRLWKGLYI
jgi:hypothetical protein